MFVQFVVIDPGTAPGGLSNGDGYFIVNKSGDTVQLSNSKGGSAIDITSNGSGEMYLTF